MNEIRQLCTTSLSPSEHLDEIFALFHACPPQYLLPSLSLIGQSISCMSVEQLDINIINHQLFLVIRQWSERLLQLWLINHTMNGDEYRALFYTHQLFKLISEWLNQQEGLHTDDENDKVLEHVITNLFGEKEFISTLCRVISQLITNESDEQPSSTTNHLPDNADQISPDDIHIQTHTSDDQAEQSDVLDVVFRCVNSLVILYSHPFLLKNTVANQNLTSCILDCLNSSLFIQLAINFLRQTSTNEKIDIRSVFLLFTCFDYCTLSITTATFDLLPSIRQILHVWCEIPQDPTSDLSPLIIRFIRLINRLALFDRHSIIQENLCAYLVPHFESLCLTSNLIDDLVSLLTTLATTIAGQRHLRRLGYIDHILQTIKRRSHLWHPLALLITQRDLHESLLFQSLIHLLTQRTIKILQSLTAALNDTSFSSTTLSSKDHIYTNAIQWFILLRTHFLSFTMIVDELINSTKKINLIHMIIDTILSLVEDDDNLSALIDVMIELIWTFSFSTSTDMHHILQIRLDFCQWLKTNLTITTSNVSLASQAILSILDSTSKSLNRTISHHRSSLSSNNLICIFYSDDSYQGLCVALRDRLQIEFECSVELILTSTCELLDLLIHLLDQSSLCLFCASTQMKIDNVVHFVYQYISCQPYSIPIVTIQMEHQCELEGSWLDSIMIVDMQSSFNEIRRHLDQFEDRDGRLSNQTSDEFTASRTYSMTTEKTQNQSSHYLNCPVFYWSSNDVSEWCQATHGNFETLKPLVMRLNGSALVHLAEILSLEPASMYHSLNEELLQRTGTSVPITEYVSLRSELENLIIQKQNQCTTTVAEDPAEDNREKKTKKNSRLCNIL